MQRRRGSASRLHGIDLPTDVRSAWVMETRRTALVLGSAQSVEAVDLDSMREMGIEVARRRTGGGAVLIVPGESRWVDLVIPAGDPLWDDDVARAFHWVGEAWADALRSLGMEAEVHRTAARDRERGSIVCFGGVGPGEVIVDGRKVVGISQRRTRGGARFQCMVHERFDAAKSAAVVRSDLMWADMVEHLALSVGVVPDVDVAVTSLLRHLP